jgi:hypothetical protein
MDLLLIIGIVLGGLLLLGVLAASFGADSRDTIGDDWARPLSL